LRKEKLGFTADCAEECDGKRRRTPVEFYHFVKAGLETMSPIIVITPRRQPKTSSLGLVSLGLLAGTSLNTGCRRFVISSDVPVT